MQHPGNGAPNPQEPPRLDRWTYIVESKTPLGRIVKENRIRLGLKQTQLADAVGILQPQISAIERGAIKFPDPQVLRRMDEVFGFPPGTLLGEAGWQGAARRIESTPPVGSLVIEGAKGRKYLQELVERLCDLSDDDHADLLAQVQTLQQHRRRRGRPQEGEPRQEASA